MMSLSEREKQALDAIGDRLAGSDPELASQLAIFSRLASGEETPVRKKIRAILRRAGHRPYRRTGAHAGTQRFRNARKLYRRLGRRQAALLMPFLISIGLFALALVLSRCSHEECSQLQGTACAWRMPSHGVRSGAPVQKYLP